MPGELTRRFEGVLLWSDSATLARRTAASLLALADAGMAVAYVAPGAVDDLAARLGGPAEDAVPLLVADSRGTGRADVGPRGLTVLHGATDEQDAALLARVGEALVGRLHERGLRSRLVPADGALGRVVVELAPGSGSSSHTAFKRMLHDHGVGGVAGLVEVTTEVAHAEGIEEPRVTVSGAGVVVSLIDTGDIALGAADELWRRGIDPLALLVLVDGGDWLPHRPVPVVVPDVREATFALVGPRRHGPSGRGSYRWPGRGRTPTCAGPSAPAAAGAHAARSGRATGMDGGGGVERQPGPPGPGRPVRPGGRSRGVGWTAAGRRPR